MALIKLGPGIADIRGKEGGRVYSKNRSGHTTRVWSMPTNPRTAAQMNVRSNVGALSSGWRSLTEAQRESWNSATENFPALNRFGESYTPTGKNLYVSLNTNRFSVGQSALLLAPAPAEVLAAGGVSLISTAGTQLLSVEWNEAIAGQSVMIFATPQLSAGVYSVNSQFRQISNSPMDASLPLDITAAYTAKFGTLIAGQKLFIKIVPVLLATGQTAVPETQSIIVGA